MEQIKVSSMYYIVEKFQCLCGFRKYLKYLLIKILCNLKTVHFHHFNYQPTNALT